MLCDGEHSGEVGAEDLDHLDGNCIDQAEHVVRGQHLLAEGVELLQFAAAAVGVVGLPPRTFGELAGNDGSEQKGEERNPVLRIGDGEGANRRQEKEVVGQGGDDGKKNRATQSPGGGNHQHGEQECESGGTGIGVQEAAEGDQYGHQSTGRQIAGGLGLQELVHSSEL